MDFDEILLTIIFTITTFFTKKIGCVGKKNCWWNRRPWCGWL